MNTRDHDGDAPLPGDDDDLRAGEYVLGVQDRAARQATAGEIAADPAFAARVDAWEQRFAPWLLRVEPVDVPERLWLRVRAGLGWTMDEGRGATVPPPRDRTAFWRGAALLATAAAVGAIAFALRPRAPLPVPPPERVVVEVPDDAARAVTVLAGEDGRAAWVATVDAARGSLRLAPVPGAALAAGQSHELWLIPAGAAPVSLGALVADHAQSVAVPAALHAALVPGSTLAVSVEPHAGIPHQAPTGPVVAHGALARL